MIELSRALVRQFRAVVRKSVLAVAQRGPCPMVVCRASKQGLALCCQQGDIGVRHHTPGSFPSASVALPFSLLADLEAGSGLVTLEQTAPFKGRASWQEKEVPRVVEFDTADPATLPPAPEPARNAVSMEAGFLQPLGEAARCASREINRYAINHILLRGRDGAVIATDGRQLLVQRGFPMPWSDDKHLFSLPVFAGRGLPHDQPVRLGLAQERITLEVGPWLLALKLQAVRYPDVDGVLSNLDVAPTKLQIAPEDANTLIRALPGLPTHDEQQKPITLDLGSTLAVRARDEKGQTAEVLLPHSKVVGPPLRVGMDRRFLLRALKLGFREILLDKGEKPLLCQDARRSYLWMPLSDADSPPKRSQQDKARNDNCIPKPNKDQ